MTSVVVGVMALFIIIRHYSADLPSTDQLANYNPPVVTRLYATDGKLLAEYAKEKRFFVPLTSIPTLVQQAFLSAEDQNFYNHKGVDVYGIGRAVYENVLNYGTGRSPVGGSTITQQVVKNFLLTSEKSLERKVKEAILAYRISNIYSKEKVLELYLNEIYLGQGTYGVAAAALNYFNKSLDELNTEEVALLAAMPKAPANYDPKRNYDAALNRRNYVISRMRDDGYINEAEAARATATPITLNARSQTETAHADYFAEEVRRRLATMYGSDVLYKGGLFVKTT
ncbi:MAG: penicillin-binding protein, partial [Alphaproteobacteria bacterium]|nr:penicillin-binding protein [Alphaproteobacteria bacterium]